MKKGVVINLQAALTSSRIAVKTPFLHDATTLCKAGFRDADTTQKCDETFGGEHMVQDEFAGRPVQPLSGDADGCTFISSGTCEQHTLTTDAIEEELPYLIGNIEGISQFASGETVGYRSTRVTRLEIMECATASKSASATARSKPATLTPGLVMQVPEYLPSGERIRVDTLDGSFISRA